MRYNVFQPGGNAFQQAVIIFNCIDNVSHCFGNVHQCVEQCIANFINVLHLTTDRFDCQTIMENHLVENVKKL